MPPDNSLNQLWIDSSIRSPQPFESLRQVNPAARSSLLEQTQRSDHRQPALRGGTASCAIIHQHGSGMDLKRETDRFELPNIDIKRVVERRGLLHDNPGRERLHPPLHHRRRVGLLELSEDGRRNYNLLEKLGEYLIDLAQNEVVKRGGIRDDNAHE
jgi:hypothetical protein